MNQREKKHTENKIKIPMDDYMFVGYRQIHHTLNWIPEHVTLQTVTQQQKCHAI